MATEESGGMTGYIKHHLQHMDVAGLHLDSIIFKVTLALFFGVPYSSKHRALADATATAEVFRGLRATARMKPVVVVKAGRNAAGSRAALHAASLDDPEAPGAAGVAWDGEDDAGRPAPPGLYVVGTPIGNLADLSPRALLASSSST